MTEGLKEHTIKLIEEINKGPFKATAKEIEEEVVRVKMYSEWYKSYNIIQENVAQFKINGNPMTFFTIQSAKNYIDGLTIDSTIKNLR